jgi:nitroreductase
MSETLSEGADAENAALDGIIRRRRSCRQFAEDVPPREAIADVIAAGMYAPYAALAIAGRPDFRRFFAIDGYGETMGEVRAMVETYGRVAAEGLALKGAKDPAFAAVVAPLIERLRVATLPKCPWLVIAAELNGFPPVASQSLAHVVQNMWLKSTALGLGLQLLSVFESMGKNEALLGLLGLAPGAYSLVGCALGYPAQPLPPAVRPDPAAATVWMA